MALSTISLPSVSFPFFPSKIRCDFSNMVGVGAVKIGTALAINNNKTNGFSISKPPPNHHPIIPKCTSEKQSQACSIDSTKSKYGPYLDPVEDPYPTPTMFSMNNPILIAPARFSVEEFNKQKNAQLEFVRVVKACDHWLGSSMLHFLTLEAVVDGVVKVYQAMVVVYDDDSIMTLELFDLVFDNGSMLRLIDNRGKGPIDTSVSRLQMKKALFRKTSTYSGLSKQGLDYHMSLGPRLARFATEEFNKRKNAQLQFVKVLRASCQPHFEWPLFDSFDPSVGLRPHLCSWSYDLMLEAVDAGVLKVYTAEVSVNFIDGMWLEEFHIVDALRLYHHLDNFYDE